MKNIIGVCVTRVQGEMCRTFLGSLLASAKKSGYRLCVFQSVYDFDEMDESGAGYVFDAIPFDKLCAVVILHDTIYDKEIKRRIIEGAGEAGIPVIMARDAAPGCISLLGEFEPAYEKLISEVIDHNDVSDVYYIGGRRNSGVDSKRRIELFRNLMARKGIYFDDTRIGFGEYYELPTYKIIDSLVAGGKKPPRAIFCANDIMALAVIERLEKHGFKVPEDSVVVGFDGLESAYYSQPRLTTCSESMDNLAQLTVDVIGKAVKGESRTLYKYNYEPVFAESAGFVSKGVDTETGSLEIFRRFRFDEADEEACNAWMDSMMTQQDLEGFKNILPKLLGNDRRIYVRPEAYWKFSDGEESRHLPDRLLSYRYDNEGVVLKEERDLVNCLEEAVESCTEDKVAFVSAISMHKVVFGLATELSTDPFNEGGRLNRFAVTLDRGFSLAISGERQLYLAEKINRSRYIDPLTGMLNIDGASRWYKNYIGDEIAKKSYMLIGVYAIITYQEILNTYGADFMEECLKYVAGLLADMNPENMMIARISSDSFAVAYVFEEEHNSSNEIEVTINTFFTALESKKRESEKWGMLEVGCGYVSDELLDRESLDGYLNAAVATLYRNRAALHKKTKNVYVNTEDGAAVQLYRHKVVDLILNDKFVYHFQPIIDATNGDIYAYEALMRTDESVGMNPLEVLEAAEMFDKYADLERTTFNHIFNRIRSQRADFEGKRVFINTIPGHFLTDVEVRNFRKEYGEILDMITTEITESQTVSPEEIDAIRHISSSEYTNDIAVDDYGMGHSNIVNLLEYKPQVVKVDRYLISNIHTDKNKQLFVKNLIEFASDAHIKVLAEGVETSEELKTVIDFGVDLIQGYYTARPAFDVIQKLPDELIDEIRKYNRERKPLNS